MANNNARKRKDIDELESSYQSIAEKKQYKYAKQKGNPKLLFIIISAVLVGCILAGIAGYFVYIGIRDNRTFESSFTIAGVQVLGQTRKDTIAAVSAAFESNYAGKELQITIGSKTVTLSPQTSAITLDAEAAVDAAFSFTGTDDPKTAFDIAKFIRLNKEAVLEQIRPVAASFASTLKQHSYTVSGNAPEELAAPKPEEGQSLTVTVGTPGISLDVNLIYDAIVGAFAQNLGSMEYVFPVEEPTALDWQKIYEEVCIPYADAILDPETFEITPESIGYGFLPADAEALMDSAKPGDVLEIPFKLLLPTVTKESLEKDLFKDVLGEMSASAGYNADRNVNLRLACEHINNMIVMPGQIFSYNEALGERNQQNGWKPGGTYVGNQLVMTYGGGICQVSSALYYATVLADLETIERDCHAYLPSYIPFSTDATVSWGWIDFKFRNNTDKPIRIEAIAEGSKVTVRITGTDERDYYVKFISETVEWLSPKLVYKEVPEDDNPEGYTDGQVLVGGTTGAKSRSYRNKYDKETNALISSTLENEDSYYVDDRVVVKIIPSEKPTDAPTEPSTGTPTDGPIQIPTDGPTDPPASAPTSAPDDTTEPPPLTPPDGPVGEDNGNE